MTMYNKKVLASNSFGIWSIMMKLHKDNQSNKSFGLAKKFCPQGISDRKKIEN